MLVVVSEHPGPRESAAARSFSASREYKADRLLCTPHLHLLPAPQLRAGEVRASGGRNVARSTGGTGWVEGSDPLIDPVGAEGGNRLVEKPACHASVVHGQERQHVMQRGRPVAAARRTHTVREGGTNIVELYGKSTYPFW